jgi:hypothetical protein
MSLESSVSFWDTLSFWLVTAGAISASLGGVSAIMFRRYNHQLVALTEQRNTQEKQASDRAIADAGVRAKEAEARAAEATLELAKFKAPRALTSEQQNEISAALKFFAGTPFDFSVQTDHESVALMAQIGAALENAGWKRQASVATIVYTPIGKPPAAVVVYQGLQIGIAESRRNDFTPPTLALENALMRAGLEVTAAAASNVGPEAIHIMVGSKPTA